MSEKKLPGEFYTRENTLQIAKDLLGKILVVPDKKRARVAGKIVEVEAYLGLLDKAAHSYQNRRTKRTEIMFNEGGFVYVYFVYGMYHQLNFVVGKKEVPHAILIRAVEPFENIETMRKRRGAMKDANLTSGPGKLCIAFEIDKSFYGESLSSQKIWLEEGDKIPKNKIASGKRIGIDYAEEYAEKPWRFWLTENPFVSRKTNG